jgi:hypothetical protein
MGVRDTGLEVCRRFVWLKIGAGDRLLSAMNVRVKCEAKSFLTG